MENFCRFALKAIIQIFKHIMLLVNRLITKLQHLHPLKNVVKFTLVTIVTFLIVKTYIQDA